MRKPGTWKPLPSQIVWKLANRYWVKDGIVYLAMYTNSGRTYVTEFDLADLGEVVQDHWRPVRYKNVIYARGKTYMHRLILGAQRGELADHINRNGLDNRRSNLRVADRALNSMNCGVKCDNTSGYRGVFWDSTNQRWIADAKFRGMRYRKVFHSKEEAAAAVAKKRAEWLAYN